MNDMPPIQALNPFMPGAGMRPPELVGREKDLETWTVWSHAPNCICSTEGSSSAD